MSTDENERFKLWMSDNNVIAHQVDFERRMGTLKGNIRSIRQLRQIFRENDFSFIHVHSPLGSILGRLVAKQFKIPTIYTAHGFHFFKGGPKSGWLFFYPLEWIFSFITDTLITINDEDFALAQKHMHAKNIVKINGIGVDVEKSWCVTDKEKAEARKSIREELNIPNDAFVILSVGELSYRKNHKLVLQALKKLSSQERRQIYYLVAGTGETGKTISHYAESFNFSDNLKLLGYRSDIHEINFASDVFVFPSFQEGLGVAGLDATVDGIYILGANRRGISDYIVESMNGDLFNPNDFMRLKNLIASLLKTNIPTQKYQFLSRFDKRNVDKKMIDIYKYMSD